MFGAAAARLAGMSAALLGWTPATFWAATPAELATVLEALTGPGEPIADGALLARMMEAFPDG